MDPDVPSEEHKLFVGIYPALIFVDRCNLEMRCGKRNYLSALYERLFQKLVLDPIRTSNVVTQKRLVYAIPMVGIP